MGHLQNNPKERKKSSLSNPYEQQLARYGALLHGLTTALPSFAEMMADDPELLDQINLKRMDHGGWLCIMKRDSGIIQEVVIAGGEDFIDAMLAADKKISRNGWKEDKPWSGRDKTVKGD